MTYKFNDKIEEKFQWLLKRYPKKQATLIPMLHFIQKDIGYLSPESLSYMASRLDISPAKVKEVASFYTMFRFKPKGKFVLHVCRTLSCHLRGGQEIIDHLKKSLNLNKDGISKDGLFSVEQVECLASCGTAPVMQVNDWEYHEQLTLEKVDQIISSLKSNKWVSPCYNTRLSEGSVA